MNALSESNIAADMTLPAREIPGSGPENMHNMLENAKPQKLNKCYTEHMYQCKTIPTQKSHIMHYFLWKLCFMNAFRVIDEINILLILNVFMIIRKKITAYNYI